MKHQTIQMYLPVQIGPLERVMEIESPLSKLLTEKNHGYVLGGTSIVERNSIGRPELKGAVIDITITDIVASIATIQEFLNGKQIIGVTIKYIDDEGNKAEQNI